RPAARGARAAGAEGRMTEQFLAPEVRPDEDELDRSLRPRRLDEFVGQERVKEQLAIALQAAGARDEALDHVLLVGPPGLGKTSLAYIVREELGVGIRCIACPALERKGDMAAILTGLERHDVLFVDEIHRLNRGIEEILSPALGALRGGHARVPDADATRRVGTEDLTCHPTTAGCRRHMHEYGR